MEDHAMIDSSADAVEKELAAQEQNHAQPPIKMEDDVMIDSWADAVEEELAAQEQNRAQPPYDKAEEIPPDSPTEPAHEIKSEEEGYEQITGSVENLTVHSPAPAVPEVPTLASEVKIEPQSPKETEATNFVPGHVICLLPEKLRIRIDPSHGWLLTCSETPPAPPRFVKPPYGAMKVGVSVDGYDSGSSRNNSTQMEESHPPNLPVFFTISDPYRVPFFLDSLSRAIPKKYIYFDQRFREMEDRKPIYDSLLRNREAKLKQAEEAHFVKLQQWRITRRFLEQEIVEAEWENKNFSIFHPEVTEEDFNESRRYVRAQNQLDRAGKIHKWFNGDPSSLIIPENKEHQRHRDTKDKDVEMTSEPAGKPITSYAEALSHRAARPGKVEIDAERKWKREEWKNEKKERRKERLSLRTHREVREARKKAIVAKRDKGVLPPRPCPKCLKPDHWRIDCPNLKNKVSKPSKKPQRKNMKRKVKAESKSKIPETVENSKIKFEDSKRTKGKYPVLFTIENWILGDNKPCEPQNAGLLPWKGDGDDVKPSGSPWD